MSAKSVRPADVLPASMVNSRKIDRVFIPIGGIGFSADLVIPSGAKGLVLCALASGRIHEPERVELLARVLEAHGIATLSFSLLTHGETEEDRHAGGWSFELDLLTHRLLQATNWAMRQPQTSGLGIGYMGAGNLAAAALGAAAQLGYAVQAVVSRSGRMDFAINSLPLVTAPTLLIVGERDEAVMEINQRALERLRCSKQLSVVPGAGHLFEEPGALDQVGGLAADWFNMHLKGIRRL